MVIFYTDDDAEDREIFKEVIEELDGHYEVHTQKSGDDLLEILKDPPPKANVIFLDLNMPVKDGFETLKEIRKSKYFGKIPIVIMTTSRDKGTAEKAKTLGADLYVSKPQSYIEFRELLKNLLARNWSEKKEDEKFYYNEKPKT